MSIFDELNNVRAEDLCADNQDGYMPCSDDMLKDLQNIASKYDLIGDDNLPLKLKNTDILYNSKLINDVNGILENSIIKTFFKPVHSNVFFHFTSASAAENILKEKKFRFYALDKRKYEGELEKIRSFDFDVSYRDELLKKFFYMSLTESNLPEQNQWGFYNGFCYNKEKKRYEYARLTVSVSSKNIMLRKMNYEETVWNLFSDLEKMAKKYKILHFYVHQMSRFAAYHLGSFVKTEHETRALYINSDESKKINVEENDGYEETYVNMDIDVEDHGYLFKIIEVKTMPRFFFRFKSYGIKVRCLLWDFCKHILRTKLLKIKE